ncbi:MAG: GNAT family N-acetyltransferase [Lysobacter sp.]|nr:GNAT family N-acetyltransferase [Lysobacter sp.]
MTRIAIGRAGEPDLNATLLDSMYRLRSEVFHERLGWDVRVEHGREHDWFDLIGPHYLVAHEDGTQALGCCRLLPTLGPNMLRDIFPSLLDGRVAPASPTIWEVSRFAISASCAGDGFGFGTLPAAMLGDMFHFAAAKGVEELVGVTSAPIERMLRHLGLHVERLGTPRRIGRVLSLAFRMPVGENLAVADRITGGTPTLHIAHAA